MTTNREHRDDRGNTDSNITKLFLKKKKKEEKEHNQIITINHPNKPSVCRGNGRQDILRIVTHLLGSFSIAFN